MPNTFEMCIRDRYNAICRENYELGEYKDCSVMSGRDGSGIAMAMRIGAKVEIATGGDMGRDVYKRQA